ncbi:hypothetical protein C8J57DRAFT_1240747 [Mycena rebaudengoi]|nr:hypothetical protein C8J57DRAFT_1240747 [Mycena rebaudengoi]
MPWIKFAESVVPRPVAQNTASLIPRSPTGIPIFPCIDWSAASPANLKQLLTEYFTELWVHMCGPDSDYPSVPWQKLLADPKMFYDTTEFSFPVAIRDPESMSSIDTMILSEFLLHNSSVLTAHPFRFFIQTELDAAENKDHDSRSNASNIGQGTVNKSKPRGETPSDNSSSEDILAASASNNTPQSPSTPLHQQYDSHARCYSQLIKSRASDENCNGDQSISANINNPLESNDENAEDSVTEAVKAGQSAPKPGNKRARRDTRSTNPQTRSTARRLQPRGFPNKVAAKQPTARVYRGYAIFDDAGNEVDRDGNILVYAAQN